MQDIALPAPEAADLAKHEAVIDRGIKTFYEVGIALADIRDRRLYRADYDTFEQYAEQRWQMARSRAYQMIEAAGIVSTIVDTELPPPSNEGQARELSRVPESARAAVWAETVDRTDGKPTAAAVRETYEQRTAAEPDLLAGDDWIQPAEPTTAAEAKPKRRPLPEAFTDASRDLVRAAERLDRLTEDDRFARNRETTHHQVPELLGALHNTARLIQAMNLPAAEASEEARRWWATSLHNLSDALRDVADSIQKEK